MLQEVYSSKYLGFTISKDLRWDDHINTITAKANRTLGFLRRNMRGCKSSARALVRPTWEYACSTWDPWNSGNIQQVEKVQRRAARFVTRNYHDRYPGSVTQMVQQLQWEPLQVRRVTIRLVLLYKIQHGLVAIPAETYLVPGVTRTRGEHKFRPPNVRNDVYKYSFFPRTIGGWNRLPPHVSWATSLEGFKNQLDTLTGYQLGVQTM